MDVPLKLEHLDEATIARINGDFPGAVKHGFARIRPGNCLVSSAYSKFMEKIYNMELRSDDVFVVSWPKNGTTWTQEMVWCICNDYNVESAKSELLDTRVPFLEVGHILDHLVEMGPEDDDSKLAQMFPMYPSMEKMLDRKSPRIFKSHLPFYVLPPKLIDSCKVVICLRNPKDVAVSYFHHHKMRPEPCTSSFEVFANYLMENLLWFSPYWDFVLDAWNKRNHPNVCLNFFEDMKKDLPSVIRKTADFLGKPATDEQVLQLTEHLDFKNMKANKSVNCEHMKDSYSDKSHSFIRKGGVGNWKEYFSPELNAKMDKWIADHLKDSDLKFTYEA